MKTKIKTVWKRLEVRGKFDEEVNKYLEKGWNLGRIETHQARIEGYNSMIFALLFKQE